MTDMRRHSHNSSLQPPSHFPHQQKVPRGDRRSDAPSDLSLSTAPTGPIPLRPNGRSVRRVQTVSGVTREATRVLERFIENRVERSHSQIETTGGRGAAGGRGGRLSSTGGASSPEGQYVFLDGTRGGSAVYRPERILSPGAPRMPHIVESETSTPYELIQESPASPVNSNSVAGTTAGSGRGHGGQTAPNNQHLRHEVQGDRGSTREGRRWKGGDVETSDLAASSSTNNSHGGRQRNLWSMGDDSDRSHELLDPPPLSGTGAVSGPGVWPPLEPPQPLEARGGATDAGRTQGGSFFHKRKPSTGLSTLAGSQRTSTGSEVSNPPGRGRAEGPEAPPRKKKSFFQRAKERVRASFRRMPGKSPAVIEFESRETIESPGEGGAWGAERAGGGAPLTRRKSWKDSFRRKNGTKGSLQTDASVCGPGGPGTSLQPGTATSTPSIETRSENGTSSSLVSPSRSRSGQRANNQSGFLSSIRRGLGSVRLKSRDGKNSGQHRPRSAEQLVIREPDADERQILSKYLSPRGALSPAAGRGSGENSKGSQGHQQGAGIEEWCFPDSTNPQVRQAAGRRHLRLDDLVAAVPQRQGAPSNSVIRMGVGGSGENYSLDAVMPRGSDVSTDGDDDVMAPPLGPPPLRHQTSRQFSKKSAAEKEELIDMIANRLASIGDELTDSNPRGERDACVLLAELARGEAGMERAQMVPMTGTAPNSAVAAAAAASDRSMLQSLVASISYDNFQRVVTRQVAGEPLVQQIALLFRLTSDAVQAAGAGTAVAIRLSQLAMRFFEQRLAGDIIDAGGWESIVEETDSDHECVVLYEDSELD